VPALHVDPGCEWLRLVGDDQVVARRHPPEDERRDEAHDPEGDREAREPLHDEIVEAMRSREIVASTILL
jgi:pyruvate-formate lyase-activating enzyme